MVVWLSVVVSVLCVVLCVVVCVVVLCCYELICVVVVVWLE